MKESPEQLARDLKHVLDAIPRLAPDPRNKVQYRQPRPRDEFGGFPKCRNARLKRKTANV